MQIDLVFKPKVNSTENIKEFVNEKTQKLEKYFHGNFHARWTFSTEKDDYKSHLYIVGNNIDYFGEDSGTNLFSTIESCVDKVEKQLRKLKEIVKDNHRQ